MSGEHNMRTFSFQALCAMLDGEKVAWLRFLAAFYCGPRKNTNKTADYFCDVYFEALKMTPLWRELASTARDPLKSFSWLLTWFFCLLPCLFDVLGLANHNLSKQNQERYVLATQGQQPQKKMEDYMGGRGWQSHCIWRPYAHNTETRQCTHPLLMNMESRDGMRGVKEGSLITITLVMNFTQWGCMHLLFLWLRALGYTTLKAGDFLLPYRLGLRLPDSCPHRLLLCWMAKPGGRGNEKGGAES